MNLIDQAMGRLQGRWMQGFLGDYYSPTGRVCAVGALLAVHQERDNISFDDLPEFRLLNDLCAREHGTGLIAFNDEPSTTEEDVLLLMKKASARLDDGQDCE